MSNLKSSAFPGLTEAKSRTGWCGGRRVTIMGLGLHGGGLGAAKFFLRQGARVLVTDLKTRRDLAQSLKHLKSFPITYVLGKHREQDFVDTDLVIKNPGVPNDSPYLKLAREHGVPIDTDIGIFFESVTRSRIIGVTGTKGKSTTATLIAAVLRQKFPRTILAGNIRTSVLDVLPHAMKSNAPIVLELSSWQLEDLLAHKKSPHVAVITNILPDHLNRYPSMRSYAEAKKHIVRFQTKTDFAVLNADDSRVRSFAKGLRSRVVWFFLKKPVPELQATRLLGKHNASNALAAVAVGKLYKVPSGKIKKVLRDFQGLEGRLELVANKKGVLFYNDTTATAPDATMASLRSFPDSRRILLIAGGTDKNLDYKLLARFLSTHSPKKLILLAGSATKKIQQELRKPEATMAKSMREAVRTAWKKAKKGDIILLSPGAASFGMFKHEFDRGEQFVRAVRGL